MTLGFILYSIIIQPIEVLIEGLFCFYSDNFKNIGMIGCIFFVSLAVNFLALPLYNIADSLQEKERETQKKLNPWITHIKKNFKGDEKFMMIQEFYRQNGYHPLYALRSSLSILIEIPFFIAAYHFLSHCTTIRGTSFLFIRDFGNPDHLFQLSIAGTIFYVNVLPILMTVINFVSGAVYLKGTPLKEKLQLYVLALIFLVLLYDSPSGLVIYWILNNIFSLLKNIFIKYVKNCRRFVYIFISVLVVATGIGLFLEDKSFVYKTSVAVVLICVLSIPFVSKIFKNHFERETVSRSDSVSLLIFSTLGFAILSGFLLPCGTISTSPSEFSYIGNVDSPVHYVLTNILFYLGLFVFWPFVIFKISGDKIRRVMPSLFSILFLMALLNAYVFSSNYGSISNSFKLDNSYDLIRLSFFSSFLPFLIFGLLIVAFLVIRKFNLVKYYGLFILVLCISEIAFGATKFLMIQEGYEKYSKNREMNALQKEEEDKKALEPIYHLSKDKKNVVIVFLDRAMSPYYPFIFDEFPEMKIDFDGFVYYPNTISFSGNTTKAVDSMLAGYEYTPEAENKRDSLLRDLHNEALLVLPRIFSDAGFDVLVTDPPLPNYSYKGDFSFFNKFPLIKVKDVEANYKHLYVTEHPDLISSSSDPEEILNSKSKIVESNLKSFVTMETMFPIYRDMFYEGGKYFKDNPLYNFDDFLNTYGHLYYLDRITDSNNDKGSFIFMENITTHEFTHLRNHTYEPGVPLSSEPPASGSYEYEIGSNSGAESDLEAYHVNAAAMIQIKKWINKLKEMNVYDNTRIIIVADHGREVPTPAFKGMKDGIVYACYNPLLMVKDFDSHGEIATDNTFMTNADTIFLAKKGLDISDINPFTGKKMSDFINKKSVHIIPCKNTSSEREYSPEDIYNNKQWKTDIPSYIVHDNIFVESNWEKIDD